MTILHGDCASLLSQLKDNSAQLIYLDPPFFTQKNHSLRTRDNLNEYSFADRWESLGDYLLFMQQVLIQCKRILKNNGSIFLHCDKSASHHLRLLLDKTFGEEHFQSEIIWSYRRWSNSKVGLLTAHQNIYFYSKTSDFKFNTIFTAYSPTTNVDQILQSRVRDQFGKSAYQRDEVGNVMIGSEKRGVPLSDVWNIPFLNPKAKERVGYPTQKPILLLERIIHISSDEGDLILDPFCGSGTTLVAAKLCKRDYIGIDISLDAVELSQQRILDPTKTSSNLLELGENSYLGKSDYERNILNALDAVPVERNSGIDGFLRSYIDGFPVSIHIQKPHETVEEAKQKLRIASQTKQCKLMILVRTHFTQNYLLFEQTSDNNLLVLDSYDLLINHWIQGVGLKKTSFSLETSFAP